MSRDLLTMLAYEAKRQPMLAAMVAEIDRMTEADIRSAPVRLPWLRQALLLLKESHLREGWAAEMAQWTVCGHAPDPVGEMRRWDGPDSFIRVGRSQLEICHGQLVWFERSAVWIDTIRAPEIDPLLTRYTVGCGRVTRSDYLAAVRARLCQLCPDTISQPIERVRFYRPG